MIGIISDIHGNLEALEAVLAADAAAAVDSWICLGDIVGYGASPNECVEIVRERCGICLLGNHDEAACQDNVPFAFNPWAARAVLWTRDVLTDRSRSYLRERPLRHDTPRVAYVHGTPIRPEKWGYVLTPQDAASQASGFEQEVCFIGHLHRPGAFELPSLSGAAQPRWLINAGSVGQPRDGDPRACLVLLDDQREQLDRGMSWIEFVRLDYDVAAAQKKILQAGLPSSLAARLAVGV